MTTFNKPAHTLTQYLELLRQFYGAYRHDQKVSALLTQLPWPHNPIILSQSKRPEECEFYALNHAQGAQP